MTLVVCFQGIDGLVLATDSRGTIGDPRELTAIRDKEQKLFKLSKYVGIASFGQASLAAQLITQLQKTLSENKDVMFIDEILEKTREVFRLCYNDWLKAIPFNERPIVGYLLGGLTTDFSTKAFYLMSNLDFAPQLCTSKTAMGGIPQYATYLVHRLFDERMKISHLINLAVYVISETATQDPKVGGPIRVATISKEQGYSELGGEEIQKVHIRNEEHNKELRRFFYED